VGSGFVARFWPAPEWRSNGLFGINGRRCFVIYLTDNEMANYFEGSKYKEKYSDFWNPNMGSSFNYDKKFRGGLPETFVKTSEELHEAKIEVVFSRQIGAEHHLRVFEINKIQYS
jgi:hypothetical protein